jgi:uncharacterized membrane protein YkoI
VNGYRPSYEVVLLQGDKVMKAALDAVSGKILKVTEQREEKEGESKEKKEIAEAKEALAKAKVTMVQALETALKEGKGAKPFKIDLEMEEGKAIYDVELLDGSKGPEMEIDAVSGRVNKVESVEEQEKEDAGRASKEEQEEARQKVVGAKAMALAKLTLTQAVQAAEKEVAGSKAYSAILGLEGDKPAYDVKVMTGDKSMEIEIDAVNGRALKSAGRKESAEGGEWRQDFKVDKTNWIDHGTNPYFILEPGYRWGYKHGATVLTITVLDETKVVDGVTTRVLEEREEKDGRPLEVSRNYFAIDRSTNDVYYFGEDVDEYKDGKVAGHSGTWLSGVDGAKFGLMMPGKPEAGDRFHQEVAPKVAMDRAEIVSLDEKLDTPAGKFEKCLQVKETTPLEKGVSHKIYALGVGLVKDDEFVLESVEKPGR